MVIPAGIVWNRQVGSRFSNPLYSENQLHQIVLMHAFFAFVVAGLQNANLERSLELLETRLSELDSILRNYDACHPPFGRLVLHEFRAAGKPTDGIKIGHAYHMSRPYKDFVASAGTADVGAWFAKKVINSVDAFCIHAVTDSKYDLNQFFTRIGGELKGQFDSDFANQFFAECGYIVSSEQSGVLADSSRAEVRRKKTDQYPECAEIMKLDWSKPFDFDSDYQLLTQQPEWPRAILRRIHTEAATLLREIRKTGTLAETLGERTKASRIRCPEIVRALVARRVVLKCAFDKPSRIKVARMIGYPIGGARAKTNEERLARKSLSSNLSGKLEDWKLEALNWGKPKEFPGFTPDEKKYFKHYLTR